jgi:phosphatidylglycerophosphatase A
MSDKLISKYHPAFWISTFFAVGKIPFAPGTFGSIAGGIVFLLLTIYDQDIEIYLNKLPNFIPREYTSSLSLYFLLAVFLFLIGWYASSSYVKITGREDPKEVVIDEVVGQLLVYYFTMPISLIIINKYSSIGMFVAFTGPFIFFRFFDIIKPWPIKWFDQNIKGGIGIMLDDIVAAIMAIITYNALLFFLIDHKFI